MYSHQQRDFPTAVSAFVSCFISLVGLKNKALACFDQRNSFEAKSQPDMCLTLSSRKISGEHCAKVEGDSKKPELTGHSAASATYQDINSTTHTIVNVVISQYDGSVVQQSLHELGNQANKPDTVLFLLGRQWVEEFGQAKE